MVGGEGSTLERLKAGAPGRIAQKFIADKGPVWSVSIAWGALFAMFPIILGTAALVGVALGFAGVSEQQLFGGILARVPDPKTRGDIAAALDGARRNSGLLGLLGLAGLYFSATSLFGTMEEAFASIYRTKPRGFVRRRLVGMAMMLAFALLGGLTILTSSLLPALPSLPLPEGWIRSSAPLLAQVATGLVAGIVLFGLIYYVVPPIKLRWAQVWPGAVVAGALFELVGLIFPIYLSVDQGINAYGRLFATFFILLTFFYLLGLITVVGAEVNAVLRPLASPGSPPGAADEPDGS